SARTVVARACRLGLLLDDHQIRVVGEDTEKDGIDQPGHGDPVRSGLRHRIRVPGIRNSYLARDLAVPAQHDEVPGWMAADVVGVVRAGQLPWSSIKKC